MEVVTSVASSLITKIGETLIDPVEKQFGYLFLYDSNIRELQQQVNKLRNQRADIQLCIEAAARNVDVVAPSVQSWVNKADAIINTELERFLEDVKVSPGCLNLKSRYSLSRKAKKKTQDVVSLQQEAPKLNKLAYPAPPPNVGPMFTEDMKFNSRQLIMDQIFQALKDDKLLVCGICGMGGVGKTRMVKSIIKIVEETKLFDEVAMSTVSQNPNVRKIQGEIADKLGLKFEEESITGRAGRLHQRIMNSKTILLVLDDVWTELNFEEVGIPSPGVHKGCKIVLTSRNDDTCKRMKSQKNFKILRLPEDEAWNLFKEIAGDSSQYLVAKEVAKECGGLPIAIVTIAKALEGKDEDIWEYALRQLRKPASSTSFDMPFVFSRIELSYKFLEDKGTKIFLLLCCLFPEDSDIPIEYLVRYVFGLKLFNGIDSLDEARLVVHAKIDKLRSSFLLLESNKQKYVKMHDVIRDAAIFFAKDEFPIRFVRNVGVWPIDTIDEYCNAISLARADIYECLIPLHFPRLELLRISGSSDCFRFYNLFQGMKKLKVLSLSYMEISSQLPTLNELRTLCFEGCGLKDGFDLGKQENLQVLSFARCIVSQLSIETGQLGQLKLLELKNSHFEKIVLPWFPQLEELYMRKCDGHGSGVLPTLYQNVQTARKKVVKHVYFSA